MPTLETCVSAIALTSTSTRGICFSSVCSWGDAVVVTISDASFCQEQEQLDGITLNFKSQQGCITALAPGNALNAGRMIHPLSWSSTRIRRICRSTLRAEAYALSDAVEHGLRNRATVVDMRGQLNIRQWEETASAATGHVWFTDCERLFAHLVSPSTKQVDNKRLASDLSALKQLIWDNLDDCDEEVDGSKGDYPRWTDTSAMLPDCLTKTMTSCRLTEIDTRPLRRVSPSKPKTGSGEHRRKSRNVCKILIFETSRACNVCRDRFRSSEAAEYVEKT